MPKMKLNQRLAPEILERLIEMQSAQKVSFEDLISAALDALAREQNLPETLLDRVENLECKFDLMMKKLELLEQKVPSADTMRHYFQIMEKQLVAHDEAELARLQRIHGRHIFD